MFFSSINKFLGCVSFLFQDDISSLKFIKLETISNVNCIAALGRVKTNPPVYSTTLCAYSGQYITGICDGDSGGGLFYNNQLVGITTWAWTCGAGLPDGFQRISKFTNWIDQVLASN